MALKKQVTLQLLNMPTSLSPLLRAMSCGSMMEVKHRSNQNRPRRNKKTSTKSYVVQQGDTLYSIAQQFDVSVDALMRANKLILLQ